MHNDRYQRNKGMVVYVKDDRVDVALRKFKKKIAESGKLQDLRDREFYEKPTTARKKAASLARNRWRKKVESQQLPKKLY